MDARIDGEVLDSDGLPWWDLHVDTDTMIVPIITGGEEAQQQAQMSAYIIKDSIPQLPGKGVDWMGFTTGAVQFGDIDSQIRDTLASAGHEDYYPTYDVVNGGLVVKAEQGDV